jgi:hypothetical protein
MTTDEARERIQSAINQFGGQAAPALDLVINEVRSSTTSCRPSSSDRAIGSG